MQNHTTAEIGRLAVGTTVRFDQQIITMIAPFPEPIAVQYGHPIWTDEQVDRWLDQPRPRGRAPSAPS